MIRRPPRSTRTDTLFPYTTLFRSRTMGATSLTTAKASYQEGYGPLLPGVSIAPYCIPGVTGGFHSDAAAVEAALSGLDEVLAAAGPDEVAAMIVEPVLGEGGYVVPPVAWLRGLRERCTAAGALLVFDEVQCGFGRTGRPFAAETFDVAPDVTLDRKSAV